MENKGLTPMSLKQLNKNKVYSFIYKEKITSKLQIVQQLEMGLSTVNQNLKILEDEGLIEKCGLFDSTGGRKAYAIRIVREARISIGIAILKSMIHIAAIDLYGTVICETAISMPYRHHDSYYQKLGECLKTFITAQSIDTEALLGVSVATQGVISPDGTSVSYGMIMGNSDMKLSDFEKYIPYPCRLEHDSKSAAYLELWNHEEIRNAIVLLLNRNLGGAIIADGNVQQGEHMRSGIIEHICIDPDGAQCYCGGKGCLETFCSASSLEAASGMEIPEFFKKIRASRHGRLLEIWEAYLCHLAFAIRNLLLVIDGAVIISGYLAPYFTEEDTEFLLAKINESTPFPLGREQLIFGTHGQYTQAIGCALESIKQFIRNV